MADTGTKSEGVILGAVRSRRTRWWLLAAACAVLLVVIGISLWLWHGRSTGKGKTTRPGSVAAPASTEAERRLHAVDAEAGQLDRDGKFAEQAKVIETYIATNPPRELAAQQTYKLGGAYLNAKDYQKAIEVFQRLPGLDPKYAIDAYNGQAMAYERLDQKPQAIDMYRKAIAAMKADDPKENGYLIAIDEQAIRNLGGTP